MSLLKLQAAANWLRRQGLPLLLLLLVCWLQLWPPAALTRPLQRLEGLLYDAKVQYLPPWPRSVSNIQIVDIDEPSLQEIGRMPWDRRQFASLTEQLSQAGAVLIVFDLLFSEAQPNNAQTLLQRWQPPQALPAAVQQSLLDFAAAEDADAQFAAAMAQSEVVLANVLHHQPALPARQLAPTSVAQQRPAETTVLPAFSALSAPVRQLAAAARGQGFINAEADADGFIRRVALLQQWQQQLYPSLALEAFRVYSLLEQVRPAWLEQDAQAYLQGVWLGNVLIRTDQQGRLLVPFRGGARHYPYTSAADVLKGRIHDGRFSQAVVFVGTSAAGLADLPTTPTSRLFPGVEIHATVFDGLMSPQTLPYRPDWWQGATLLQLLLLALLCGFLLPTRAATGVVVTTLLLLGAVVLFNLTLWRQLALDLPLLGAVLLVLWWSVYAVVRGFLLETRQRQQVTSLFGQYLPAAHIERILRDPAAVSLAGEKKQLSVLFCDIRDFTAIAETMSAQQLKIWLNQYFSALTRAILAEGGTIDKYVGDMVMAFWGAPLDEPEHARQSVLAALAMIAALEPLNRQFAALQQPAVAIGIGINSGEMNVGDMGSDFRRSYTVIGDAVNLASRLEGLTKFYGVPLLVSQYTRALAPQFDYLLVDKVRVKGRQLPLDIYLPLQAIGCQSQDAAVLQFEAALGAYVAADFAKAEALFSAATTGAQPPALAKLRRLYQQRCSTLLQQPPGPDWDGCYQHEQK